MNRTNTKTFVPAVLRWYRRRGRRLPWRGIRDPYRILLSEVMLQQTQVSRVLVKYPEFLRRFPTLQSLAAATQGEVVWAWRGMGYNNRAVRLHRLARQVVAHHNGRLPRTYAELISLPGVGKYTANAVLSSAFNAPLPVVDVNVRRLLSRVFWRLRSTVQMRSEAEIWTLAGLLLPRKRAYDFNQALMDLGATICTARLPRCNECPVASLCASHSVIKPDRRRRMRPEPSLDGIPNRIYRGRVVEALRQHNGRRRISAAKLGNVVYPAFGSRSHGWFRRLLAGLERDGLIRITGNGSITTQRVVLA